MKMLDKVDVVGAPPVAYGARLHADLVGVLPRLPFGMPVRFKYNLDIGFPKIKQCGACALLAFFNELGRPSTWFVSGQLWRNSTNWRKNA
jgi:hypothetical protein